MGGTRLSFEDESAVVDSIERWIKHGHFPYHSLAKDAANAYCLNHHGYNQNRQNVTLGWQKGFWQRHPELAHHVENERKSFRLRGPHEDRRAWKFFQSFKETRQRLQVPDAHIYAMDDAGYVTTMYRKTNAVFLRPENPNSTSREERIFSSVIHCCSTQGKHLPPYIICRSQVPPQTKSFGQTKVFSNQSGWAEANHALDWLKNVFEPGTRPRARRETWRMLLISHRFRVIFPEFEQFCWHHKIACLCFPNSDQQFFNPIRNIVFGPMRKNYSDFMIKKLSDNNKNAIVLEVAAFVSWIQGEVASSSRMAEAADVWRSSCLVPLDETRLRNCLQGNRATAGPEDTGSNLDSRIDSEDTRVRRATTHSTSRTSVPLPTLASTDDFDRSSSPEYSPPSPRPSQGSPKCQQSDDSSESEDTQSGSGSESESISNSQPITPCKTPRPPKGPRARTPETDPTDSVMSAKEHRDTLDKCIDGTPRTKKRYRDDLILDRGDLEKENARLKERVKLLERFAVKMPRLE
ncbi:uncharacterized protein N7515_001357 [Penicillium bovifimosum]|uniref:DDE-1 domain-containing protein n=1 Tax=Penicillium bovifimosum TaxID=126998 RepID=A0A9W9HA09_9EURO|nr:uncharacterized protein N7515_001357 [Penicillium bovifimosum]KAJ5142570.1 hypothetical protein N7515_001357 [Penicillium bovifimosum]